ncbi:MAG: hypothetical protein DIZ78_09515 [endosymbiont of Escarpia spicata]|uniref:Uncharacterized protein n=1 Tax=endosymbiont of Escarpia spicata TaxID=2200908 RepID=A0A370DQ18_9GAMM|nr:MAG: hypothetical protein DIZ78_09515 [endosymbiont of Escarpia spicata]
MTSTRNNESAHTPGSWNKDRWSNVLAEIDGDQVAIAEVFTGATDTIEEARANQRLMAAAPDLYAACKAMSDWNYDPLEALKMIHEAVAKAERVEIE